MDRMHMLPDDDVLDLETVCLYSLWLKPRSVAAAAFVPKKPSPARLCRGVIKTLRPGQPGTERHLRMHGDRLVCVRYRQDGLGRTRFTTVELVVDEAPLKHRNDPRTIVSVRLAPDEVDIRGQAVAAGATWDECSQAWRMTWGAACALGLETRAHTRRPRGPA